MFPDDHMHVCMAVAPGISGTLFFFEISGRKSSYVEYSTQALGIKYVASSNHFMANMFRPFVGPVLLWHHIPSHLFAAL